MRRFEYKMTEAEKAFDARFQFRVSYDLECEYVDRTTGLTYRLRLGCHHSNTRDDYLPTVQALIGTVTRKWRDAGGSYHEFPPDDVVAMFAAQCGVPLVGAKYERETWRVLYNGRRPHVSLVWSGTTSMLTAHAGLSRSRYIPSVCDFNLF